MNKLKHNQAGAMHLVLIAAALVCFAIVGVYLLVQSKAEISRAAYSDPDLGGYYPAEPDTVGGPVVEPDVPVYKTETEDAIASEKLTGADSTVKLVTFNYAHFKPASGIGDAIRFLSLEKHADVIGLQEFGDDSHRNALKNVVENCKDCHLGLYMLASERGGKEPIVWNKDKLEAVGKDTIKVYDRQTVEDGAGGPNVNAKFINVVILKEKASGRKFAFINTHLIPTVEAAGRPNHNKPKRVALYEKHMKALADTVQKYQRKGITSFVTADYNVNYRADSREKYQNFPYRVMGEIDMWANWRIANPPSSGTYGSGNRVIDYIFSPKSTQKFELKDTGLYAKQTSDHFPVWAEYTVKH